MCDCGNKMMKYIGEVMVNGFFGIERMEKKYFEVLCVLIDIEVLEKVIIVKNILDV